VDSDDWPGLLLLAAALVLLALVTAAEVAVASSHRVRPSARGGPGEKGPFRSSFGEGLADYLRESREVFTTLALARSLALVGSTAIVVYLVLREAGINWSTLAVTFAVTLAGLALIQTVPRIVVSASPQRWATRLWPVVAVVRFVLRPAAMLLDLPAVLLLRGSRARAEEPTNDTEELLSLAEMKNGSGTMDAEEREMIRGVMALEETTTREIMVPRTDIVAVASDASFDEVARLIVEQGYSRIPVFENTIDNIIGVVHAREVLGHLTNGGRRPDVKSLARPAYFVPESKRVDELLTEMRRNKLSIAIVVDEYGGTAGLVTVEDLLEEIVGEIADEFDRDEESIHRISDNEAILDASVGIDELEELFGVKVEEGDFDSVGGFILSHLGKMPTTGEEVRVDGLVVRILSVSGRRIKRVRVIKEEPPPANGGNGA
jgi:CBS domain containing-hemolysin-like protein